MKENSKQNQILILIKQKVPWQHYLNTCLLAFVLLSPPFASVRSWPSYTILHLNKEQWREQCINTQFHLHPPLPARPFPSDKTVEGPLSLNCAMFCVLLRVKSETRHKKLVADAKIKGRSSWKNFERCASFGLFNSW